METEFRAAVPAELPGLHRIFAQARAYMQKAGFCQWQNGYPTDEQLRADMAAGASRVWVQDGRVAGTLMLSFVPETDYDVIEQGAWLSQGQPYAVVHRVAVDDDCKGQGLAGRMLACAEAEARAAGYRSVRVDTHLDNSSMQQLLRKQGFVRCGIIHVSNQPDPVRVGFEKWL